METLWFGLAIAVTVVVLGALLACLMVAMFLWRDHQLFFAKKVEIEMEATSGEREAQRRKVEDVIAQVTQPRRYSPPSNAHPAGDPLPTPDELEKQKAWDDLTKTMS